LLNQLKGAALVQGDKGYDTNAVREKIEAHGAAPTIPPKITRTWKNCFSPALYRDRNAIEPMFNRIKDFRRIATRYDRLATNFHAAICIVAAVSFWL
jgi:transposase